MVCNLWSIIIENNILNSCDNRNQKKNFSKWNLFDASSHRCKTVTRLRFNLNKWCTNSMSLIKTWCETVFSRCNIKSKSLGIVLLLSSIFQRKNGTGCLACKRSSSIYITSRFTLLFSAWGTFHQSHALFDAKYLLNTKRRHELFLLPQSRFSH